MNTSVGTFLTNRYLNKDYIYTNVTINYLLSVIQVSEIGISNQRLCNRRDSGVSRGDGCERKNGAQRSFGANVIARGDDPRS
jgi:hypothetical protein